MSVLYLSTAPYINDIRLDAAYQEMTYLKNHFGGDIISLFPFKKPNAWYPKKMYGFHNWNKINSALKKCDLVHVYASGLYDLPILNKISKIKPIIITSLTPDIDKGILPNKNPFQHILLSSEIQKEKLQNAGFKKTDFFYPIIELKKDIESTTFNNKNNFKLLMASAPWISEQFNSKSINQLIEIAEEIDNIELTFIWRNLLFDEMQEKINRSAAKNRIHLINGYVEIEQYIEQTHAAILAVSSANIVKSFPHSLVENLIAHRPVILTKNIALHSLVNQWQSGISIENNSKSLIKKAIISLMQDYSNYSNNCSNVDAGLFNKNQFISNHEALYQSIK